MVWPWMCSWVLYQRVRSFEFDARRRIPRCGSCWSRLRYYHVYTHMLDDAGRSIDCYPSGNDGSGTDLPSNNRPHTDGARVDVSTSHRSCVFSFERLPVSRSSICILISFILVSESWATVSVFSAPGRVDLNMMKSCLEASGCMHGVPEEWIDVTNVRILNLLSITRDGCWWAIRRWGRRSLCNVLL